ncbi:tRNA glutamyl-Q(34) synthetase GluQRS [Pseudoflavonifractor sp. 524-17]|uniref:tRNA glutamyl-Q(34) synthetase GluQRS n=1 Tax=Pseudoflavonifractor sp. 524-17 TaxID=2304577 RepID=UPI001379D73A|nr:tRNA glutamyl-Q(34) synthetase GluQRS [Pseudoflavonifractor sp. 524-17]
MDGPVRGRFAPSPSGRMHLGNVFTALLAWLSVRAAGGTMVLRMEDLDPDRCRSAYARQVAEDLRWLGLDWDEGYEKGGPYGPYLQSARTSCYAAAFAALEEKGLIYPCYCTRAERLAAAAPHQSDGQTVYNGRCRSLSPEGREALARTRRPAWRVMVPEERVSVVDGHLGPFAQRLDQDCGDFIVRRSDGVYAYQLAVVADDGAMQINQVVRGRDLLDSTPRQCWLYRLLGLPEPKFFHVPLLLAEDGRRLSKRDGDLDLSALGRRFSAPEIVGRLAFLAGLQPAPRPCVPQMLIPAFSWGKITKNDIILKTGLF